MLILARKPDQGIHIGGDIRVVVLSIKGRRVRVGIEAPANVPIRRAELFDGPPGLPSVDDLSDAGGLVLHDDGE